MKTDFNQKCASLLRLQVHQRIFNHHAYIHIVYIKHRNFPAFYLLSTQICWRHRI